MNETPAVGTWRADPWHFRRASRRDFLRVGVLGGLGLSLGDFFTLRARAEQKTGVLKDGPAKSVINIFLPGGMAAQVVDRCREGEFLAGNQVGRRPPEDPVGRGIVGAE